MSTVPVSLSHNELQPLPKPDRSLHSSRVRIKEGQIKNVRHLNYDTMEITIECKDDGTPPLFGVAGQYATLSTREITRPRSFSFAYAPESEANENEHTFLVRMLPDGKFSGWLFEKDRTGTPITISGPLGAFKLDSSEQPMICIAGGSGMSAIKAILEHAAHQKVKRDCVFLYGGRQQKDLYYDEEFEAIKKNWNPNHKFEFVQVLSDEPEDSDWKGARGRVTDYFKKHYIDAKKLDMKNVKTYFCGPPLMIDAGVQLLTDAGCDEENIYYDKFEDMSSPAPVIDNDKCVLCDECLLVKPTANCIVEAASIASDLSSYKLVDPAITSGLYYNSLFIDENACIRCFACVEACPVDAISVDYDKTPKALRRMVSN